MRFENGTVLYPICTINTGWDKTEDAANARLVAAAPELLEALHDVLPLLEASFLDHEGTPNANPIFDGLEKVRNAIAKATGGAA